ncbi:histidine phosphatase family protein [Muricoccus radiodurans]|uniref:histidine phosphatase family protein n=1 Tax=Muricoccus radiodurans TaxID=2231721 RepID=UPI003CF8B0FE
MIVLARHGNTFAPGERAVWVGARTDLPLVEEGRRQAERLAAALRAEGFAPARILTGPLRRTREAAGILAGALGGMVTIDDRLRELDYGAWEGLDGPEVTARFGAAALESWEKRLEWPAGAGWGEDEAAVTARIAGFLDEASAGAGPLLAVTSNGILRIVRRLIEGRPSNGEGKVRTGAACRLEHAGGAWRIVEWDVRP